MRTQNVGCGPPPILRVSPSAAGWLLSFAKRQRTLGLKRCWTWLALGRIFQPPRNSEPTPDTIRPASLSDVCPRYKHSHLLLQRHRQVAAQLRLVSPRELAIPSVVLYELETGLARSTNPEKRRRALNLLVAATRVLPFDGEAARFAAAIRASLEAAGTPIGPLDTLIAGTALAHSAVLVTHNSAEFSRVPGLRLTDWY
jgi:tRNA(fMet)-specific endonuclease VapC